MLENTRLKLEKYAAYRDAWQKVRDGHVDEGYVALAALAGDDSVYEVPPSVAGEEVRQFEKRIRHLQRLIADGKD